MFQFKPEVIQLHPWLLHREVKDIEEAGTSLDVSEERNPQATILMCSTDEAWDVSHCTAGLLVSVD